MTLATMEVEATRRNAEIWDGSRSFGNMLLWLKDAGGPPWLFKPSQRKLRLFLCACARQGWNLLKEGRGRLAVMTAEKCADGIVSSMSLRAASVSVIGFGRAHGANWLAGVACEPVPVLGPGIKKYAAEIGLRDSDLCDLLRDVLGNPFATVRIEDASEANGWRMDAQVRSLAESAYTEREDDGRLSAATLLVLSDAMEEAGCARQELLAPLRAPVARYRGFHVLDLVLGRS